MKFPRTIYALQHNKTKRMYIGSSANIERRYLQHISALRVGHHPVEDLQKDFDRYGEDFSLFALERITKWAERNREYEWMVKYKTYIRGIGYNYKDHATRQLGIGRESIPFKEGLPPDLKEREL